MTMKPSGPDRNHFWTIVGSAAGVVGVIVAIVAIVVAHRDAKPPPTVPPGAGTVAAPPVTGPPPQTQSGSDVQPVWTGAVRITGDGLTFADEKPHPIGINTPYYPGSVYKKADLFIPRNAGAAALWLESVDPTYTECVDYVNAQPLSGNELGGWNGIKVKSGTGLCYAFGNSLVFLRVVDVTAEAIQAKATKYDGP
jgi:hypothetical protein